QPAGLFLDGRHPAPDRTVVEERDVAVLEPAGIVLIAEPGSLPQPEIVCLRFLAISAQPPANPSGASVDAIDRACVTGREQQAVPVVSGRVDVEVSPRGPVGRTLVHRRLKPDVAEAVPFEENCPRL